MTGIREPVPAKIPMQVGSVLRGLRPVWKIGSFEQPQAAHVVFGAPLLQDRVGDADPPP